MGNCLIRSSKAVAATEEHEPHREGEVEEMIKRMTTITASELERKNNFDGGKSKQQTVRFRVRRESRIVDVEPKGEALRIRVVVTQEELKQILDYKKNLKSSSIEQLMTALKLRGRTDDQVINGNWKPALESIPEDH